MPLLLVRIHGSIILDPGKRSNACLGRRVDEVQKLVGVDCWHSVESNINPADLLSRDFLFSEILQNNLWFQGPSPLLLGDAAYSEFKTYGRCYTF